MPLPTTLFLYIMILRVDLCINSNITCDNVSLSNGAVYRTNESSLVDYIKFECQSSYYLEGAGSLNCSVTPLNISTIPTCVLKQSCTSFAVSRAVLSSPNDGLQSFLSPAGSIVNIVCNDGYTTDHTTLTCHNNGTWDYPIPKCRLKGKACVLRDGWLKSKFISTNATGSVHYGDVIQAGCVHGYYSKSANTNFTCEGDQWEPSLENHCLYIGFYGSISNGTSNVTTSSLTFDKGVSLMLTCDVRTNSSDGLPLPQITWVYPTKLKDYVDKTHASVIHTVYAESISPSYSTEYNESTGMYSARGVLAINTTMDVHRGTFSCQIRLVDETKVYEVTLAINSKYVVAMWCLIILPVVLCMAIHCFYRNASNMSPFPANRLTKHMLQDGVDHDLDLGKRDRLLRSIRSLRHNDQQQGNVHRLQRVSQMPEGRRDHHAVYDID